MDSVTQIVLGAGIAGLCAPAEQRRAAMLLGAGLGTLPDLDVFIDFGGAVENFTYHRGFSHSLVVLGPFGVVLWWLLRRCWPPVQARPMRWLAVILLALLTHPLLDAHTAYGTQLGWPLALEPTAWATLFIIDPLFTAPLLISVLLAFWRPRRRRTGLILSIGLALSCAYLAWSWLGKTIVERELLAWLDTEAGQGLVSIRENNQAAYFITPSPFNTLLWRIVVMTDTGYLEGLYSVIADTGPLQLRAVASANTARRQAGHIWAVQRLAWFSRGFIHAEQRGAYLLLVDLRMGQYPYYAFTHRVARRGDDGWQAIETELLPSAIRLKMWPVLWRRIWTPADDERL